MTTGYLDENTNIGGGAIDFFNALAGPKRMWIGWWDHVRGNDMAGDRLAMGRAGLLRRGHALLRPAPQGQRARRRARPGRRRPGQRRALAREAAFPPADAQPLTAPLNAGTLRRRRRATSARTTAAAGPGGTARSGGRTTGAGAWTFSPPLRARRADRGRADAPTVDVAPVVPAHERRRQRLRRRAGRQRDDDHPRRAPGRRRGAGAGASCTRPTGRSRRAIASASSSRARTPRRTRTCRRRPRSRCGAAASRCRCGAGRGEAAARRDRAAAGGLPRDGAVRGGRRDARGGAAGEFALPPSGREGRRAGARSAARTRSGGGRRAAGGAAGGRAGGPLDLRVPLDLRADEPLDLRARPPTRSTSARTSRTTRRASATTCRWTCGPTLDLRASTCARPCARVDLRADAVDFARPSTSAPSTSASSDVLRRVVAAAAPRRSFAGTSSLTTWPTSALIWPRRNFCIRSSWRRYSFASFAVSLSFSLSASDSMRS